MMSVTSQFYASSFKNLHFFFKLNYSQSWARRIVVIFECVRLRWLNAADVWFFFTPHTVWSLHCFCGHSGRPFQRQRVPWKDQKLTMCQRPSVETVVGHKWEETTETTSTICLGDEFIILVLSWDLMIIDDDKRVIGKYIRRVSRLKKPKHKIKAHQICGLI